TIGDLALTECVARHLQLLRYVLRNRRRGVRDKRSEIGGQVAGNAGRWTSGLGTTGDTAITPAPTSAMPVAKYVRVATSITSPLHTDVISDTPELTRK